MSTCCWLFHLRLGRLMSRRPLCCCWGASVCILFVSIPFRWSNKFFSGVLSNLPVRCVFSLCFGCWSSLVLQYCKPCLKYLICAPFISGGGIYLVYDPGFAAIKQNIFRSDYKAVGLMWVKNTAGWWRRQPGCHAAADQDRGCLILNVSLTSLGADGVDARLTICALSSNLSNLWLEQYLPECNYCGSWEMSVYFFRIIHCHCASYMLPVH
jgi:hypothetical protein